MTKRSTPFSPEVRERAVRMVFDHRALFDVAFVIDAFARRIVGWRASRTAHAGFVLDALEQALPGRQPLQGDELVHHSDRGSQYLALRYTEQLAEAGVEPSVGSPHPEPVEGRRQLRQCPGRDDQRSVQG